MKTFTSSSLLLLLSLGVAFSEPVQFPSTSAGSLEKDASSSSTSSVGDHEESEQVQAFVIADPSQSASSSASTRGGDSEDGPDAETVNPLAASLLLNLALNNMAATMAYPPGGQPFRPSSKGSDCGCGCKCGHGSRGVLCSYCQERGWGRGSSCPCAKERSLELRSSDMVSAGSNFYPIYYDPSSGVVLPGQERASQFQNPWTPIAAATYARPTYAYRPVPRYYYSPQYYVPPSVTQQPSMAASYPVPAYAYPPVSYAAASTPVYAIAAARPAPVVIARRSSFLPYYGPFSSPYAMMPKYAAGYF